MLDVLQRHGVRYVVVGAFSAVVQGYPLATFDLDVTPARDAENLERLADALRELGARLRVPRGEPVPFPVDAAMLGQGTAWTLATDAGPLDVVFEPAGTAGYDDLVADSIEIRIRDMAIRLASVRDVIRMKEAAGREKDMLTLPALRRTLEEIRRDERARGS
jgi:hypothetical protein